MAAAWSRALTDQLDVVRTVLTDGGVPFDILVDRFDGTMAMVAVVDFEHAATGGRKRRHECREGLLSVPLTAARNSDSTSLREVADPLPRCR